MEDHGFMELERRKAFLIKLCYWGVIALCTYMAVKFLLPVLFPFTAAYAIAYVLDHLADPSVLEFLKGGFDGILKAFGDGFLSLSNRSRADRFFRYVSFRLPYGGKTSAAAWVEPWVAEMDIPACRKGFRAY